MLISAVTVSVVTALSKEYAAARQALGATYEAVAGPHHAPRVYSLARVPSRLGGEHVVALTLPPEMGNNISAALTANLLHDCPNVRHVIMCGIAGAVPHPEKPEDHVRLGDIVVSDRQGVIQYDLVKQTETVRGQSRIEHRHPPRPPSAELLGAVQRLKAREFVGERPWEPLIHSLVEALGPRWRRPGDEYDRLQDWDGRPEPAPHPPDPDRRQGEPRVFHGPIASANILLKDAAKRDAMRERFGIKAAEMEGSGVADATWFGGRAGYLVVRGTCDYCNPDKGDRWQMYASLIAAVYTRTLIEALPGAGSDDTDGGGVSSYSAVRTPLGSRSPSLSSAQAATPIYRNTVPPRPQQGVIGRTRLVRSIVDAVASLEAEGEAGGGALALWGTGGIGKTTLAIEAGHHADLRRLFPDGVLWTALGPRPKVRERLGDLAGALGVDLLPDTDEAACAARLRGALYALRLLLIIDDVWEESHVDHFLVAGPHSRTLVTTREVGVAHFVATRERTREVGVLSPGASLSLLRKLAREAVRSDEPTAKRLCERLGYLPLGLTLAGRLLAREADVPSRLRRVMDELSERRETRLRLPQAEGRLGLSEGQPTSLWEILGMSVERLAPPDQERFALLSLFGAEPLNWNIEEACSVWACPREEAEATTSRLIQRGLVSARGEYFWMHALLADYATALKEGLRL